MPITSTNRLNTYTGCWTCKTRKIKCDERPVRCKNCEKKGVVCGGYDIQLQWVCDPLQTPSYPGRGRRMIKLDKNIGNRYHLEQIDSFLAGIDSDAESGLVSSRGPFSSFSVMIDGRQESDGQVIPSINCFSVLDFFGRRQSEGTNSKMADHIDNEVPAEQSGSGSPIIAAPSRVIDIIETQTEASTCNISSPLLWDVVEDVYCSNLYSPAGPPTLSSASASSTLFESASPVQHITTSLFGDVEVDLLLNHYNIHIADLMQPVFHTQNVFRGIYLSTALEGSVVCTSNPHTSKALAYSAIYHSLLASSAFHLWNCNTNLTKYQRLGAKHKHQALFLLQSAVENATPGADYKIFLTAMLALLSIGTMSGDSNDFIAHINATTQLRNLRGSWRMVSHSTQQLNSISAFLAIIAETTSFEPNNLPDCIYPCSDDAIVRSSTCYEHIYGITPSIATAIQETCRLAKILAKYTGKPPHSIPDGILRACETLGDQLISWKLTPESIKFIPSDDEMMLTIFKHQANAWHKAALMYYHRRIQNFNAEDLVAEVRSVAEHMNAAEEAKATFLQSQVFAPITWPGFIASCEAVGSDRDAFIKWWKRIGKYNIGNIQKQWAIIQRLWGRDDQLRENGLGAADWIESLRIFGFKVLAV